MSLIVEKTSIEDLLLIKPKWVVIHAIIVAVNALIFFEES